VSRRKTRIPVIATFYEEYLDDQDSSGFVRMVARSYTPGTLERLAVHPQRTVRRAAVLALGFLGEYEVNHTLGRAMLDDDRTVRMLAENGIRMVWTRVGTDEQRQRLAIILRLNSAQHYDEAIHRATALLADAPGLAEAWNQRSLARFHRLQFSEAIRDAHQALEINPYHFIAATTMGQSYLELGNRVSALECFRRALRLNPDLEGVRAQVVRLARMVEGK
jgi:tetratricopeptide (TPR) repeat protein